LNNNTGKIEVGLVEEVYADKENTDQPVVLLSSSHAPFLVSVAIIRNTLASSESEDSKILVILDPDQTEMQCIDQIMHLTASLVDGKIKIHSMVQSKGEGSEEQQSVPGVPSNLFLVANL
jgi:hypothetical protein